MRHHTRAFSGGEVTPEFYGRIDDQKFQTGLSRCRNFMVQPHGPVENRPGTRFVRHAKHNGTRSRLLPFIFSFDQQLVIEVAVGAFRFHALGQTVLNAGVPYEVAHPYTADEIFELTYAQSGDILRLRHRNHPRRSLRRIGATNWTLTDDPTGPTLPAPTGLAGTAHPGDTPGTPFNTDYVVTALNAAGDESLQSASVTVSNNLFDDGAYNELEWNAVAGADRYNVYKRSAGLFGYIGQTDQLEWKDDNISPNLGLTPPLEADLFDDPGEYPGAVSYFEQRLVEAGSLLEPQNLWGSKSGTDFNFNYSIPPRDDDSLQFKIAAREASGIKHLVAMGDLLALTPTAVWKIGGGNSDVLTPFTISARQQTFVGSGPARPLLIGNNMLYTAARGGHVRELGFDTDRGYLSGDVCVRAPHLFDGFSVVSMSAQQAPYPVVWMTSSSGRLIGFTYIPEQQIGAFHWHDTKGEFEDVTVIGEDGRDVAYVAVKRFINGQTVRCIEYFADRLIPGDVTWLDDEDVNDSDLPPSERLPRGVLDQYFVDCGATYDGPPVTTISGLDWLEGEEVAILTDGGVAPNQIVINGEIELDEPAGVVHIGLPYVSELQSLPLAVELQGYGQGMPKDVSQTFLRVYHSSGLEVGPSFDEMTDAKVRSTEAMSLPVALRDGMVDVVPLGAWTEDGQICVRNAVPQAVTILSLTVEFAVGG